MRWRIVVMLAAVFLAPHAHGQVFNYLSAPQDVTPGTTDSWVDVNVSAWVPAGATGVILQDVNSTNGAEVYGLRKNGSSDTWQLTVTSCRGTSLGFHMVGVDANRIFECYTGSTSVKTYLLGYTMDGVTFFDNAVDKSISATDTWTDVDISADTGGDTAIGAVFVVMDTERRDYLVGLRMKGSSDELYEDKDKGDADTALVGLDGNEVAQMKIENTNVDLYLIGYVTSGAVFFTNAVIKATSTTDIYVDVDITGDIGSDDANGAIVHLPSGGDNWFAVRRNGATYDYYESIIETKWPLVAIDSNDIFEQKISSTGQDLYLTGYTLGTTLSTISSASNQVFGTGDPATAISAMTVTDTEGVITAADDIRIRIPAGFNMVWDSTDTIAAIGGAASSNMSTTVSYEDSDATLVLNVTSDFAGGDVITVSDLRFASFTAASLAANLELEVYNDDVVTATDDKTVSIAGGMGTTTFPFNYMAAPVEVGPSAASTWEDVDVSAYVPVGTTGVMIQFVATGSSNQYGVRKNGSTDTWMSAENTAYADTTGFLMTGVDASRVLEVYEEDTAIKTYLVGYTMEGVTFFTNAINKSLSTSGSYQDIDISGDTTGTAIGAILTVQNTASSEAYALRKKGSTDDRYDEIKNNRSTSCLVGVDAGEICEMKIETTAMDAYLVGYVTSGAVFFTNGVNKSTGTTDSYVDVDITADLGGDDANGAILQVFSNGGSSLQFGVRKNGASYDYYGYTKNEWAYVAIDAADRFEQKIGSSSKDLFLIGYTLASSPPSISSAANQSFFVGDPATAMSTITVTDTMGGMITAANDIRIRIPAGFNMTWDGTDTTAVIGGAASSKVSTTMSYEDSDATLVLAVTSDFAAGDVITVSDLSFASFTGKSSAAKLQLEINNDDVVTATDDKTIFIGTPTYRSIGTDVGDRYSVGDVSTTAGSSVVTFAGGAVLPADIGVGDKLTIGGVLSPIAFDNVTAQTFASASSHNLNHAIGGGGERVLIVTTSHETNPPRTITGVTYDGQALAFAGAQEASSDTGLRVEMWYLLEANLPAAGTYQTTVNWSGSAQPGIAVLSLDGVAQQAPEATSSSNCLDCTTISTNITTLTDGAWVVSNVGNGRTFTYTGHGSGQVERWDQNPNSATHSGTTRSVATAGLVSISETASGQANRHAHVVAAFAPAFMPDLYILSRDSATEVTVQQNATSSQSNGTYTIERAYNTMQAWEDDRDGDLVTETRREIGVCYNDGVFTDRLVISGSTTDVKYYMALTVAAGERHNGVRNSGARIDAPGGWTSQNAIDVEDEYTRIEWLEITDVVDAGDGIFFDDSPAADNSIVAGVFVHGFWQNGNAAFRVAADNITIRNCFATGGTTYAARIEPTGSVMIENCTFWGSSGGGYGVYGVAGSDVGVRNTISVDHGTLDMYIGTDGGATISYYGYNLFITYGGGFDPNDIAYARNNQVPPVNLERLFADLSTSDLHLELTGHRAGNRGRDLSSSFTGDIDGTTRTVTWDIGADEGVPGTDPLPPRIVRWQEVEP